MQGNRPIIFWSAFALAVIVLLGEAYFLGNTREDAISPDWFVIISSGCDRLENMHLIGPAIIMAAGAALGAESVRQSMTWIVIGTALIALVPVFFIVGSLQLGYQAAFDNPDPMLEGAKLPDGSDVEDARPAVMMFLAFSAPLFYFLFALPLGAIAAAVSFLIRLALDALNDVHSELGDSGSEDVVYGIVGGVFVVGLAGYFLLLPSFSGNNEDPGSIIARLQPPQNTGPLIGTPEGKEGMRKRVKRMADERVAAARDLCSGEKRFHLKSNVTTYFDQIRVYEDWKPGQELSEISREAVKQVELALDEGILGWKDVRPSAAIFLDHEKYESAAKRVPENCPKTRT